MRNEIEYDCGLENNRWIVYFLTPQFKAEALLRDAGLVDVKLAWVNEMSWSAMGTRPEVT